MSAPLRQVLDASRSRRVVWLDWVGYARRLFAPDQDVWTEPGRFIELTRQAQRLLGSEVVELRLGDFHRAAVSADPALVDPFRNRRATTVLRRLLENRTPAQCALQVTEALHSLFPTTPVALVVDGAAQWLQWSAGVTGADVEVGRDSIDTASVYIAEMLRTFGSSPVSGLVLDLKGALPAPLGEVLELHRPVLNVANHYDWVIGVLVEAAVLPEALGLPHLDVLLCPELGLPDVVSCDARPAVGGGLNLPFWEGNQLISPPGHVLAYGEVPRDAKPEVVLAQLETLRKQ